MNTTTEVQFVAVGDDHLLCTVDDAGDVWVGIRRVSEALGLDSDTQRRKLKALPWARTDMITVPDTMGRAQMVAVIALRSLPMWLATIDHNRVGDDVAKKLVRFQLEAHDVLAAHFGASGSGGRMHGHTATSLGVAGVGAARIRAILDGVDDPTRPGAIDAEVTSMSTVAARSADRTAP